MVWVDGMFYVVNYDVVLVFVYMLGVIVLIGVLCKLMDLLVVGNYWMCNLLLSFDGKKFYVVVGLVLNIGECGMEIEVGCVVIWEIDFVLGSWW